VTIQESGWESFSEDEKPAVTVPKAQAASSTPPAAANKPKKAGVKGSQGNIMSFFAKK
jgi:DNA polymerase delta subunit 3